jgi:putative transposase
MARKLRVEYEGAIYHVTMRGVERRSIFNDDGDRERFLLRLGEAKEACGVRVYLFALMRNHVHLMVETPQANLSAFMHKLQTAYTVYYNRRHRRAGHLMQGRFGAVPVQGDKYLLNLSRYIHLNPVFVGCLRRQEGGVRLQYLREYRWSSYRGYAGLAQSEEWMDEAPILALTAAPEQDQRRAYRRFVETGMAETDKEFEAVLKTSRWGIGDGEFQERIRDRHTELACQARRPEDVSFRRVVAVAGADAVLHAVAEGFGLGEAELRRRQYKCVARSVAALMLCRHAGMNQRDAASYLKMGSGAAVCQQLKTLRERLACEPELAARLTAITTALKSQKSSAHDSTL